MATGVSLAVRDLTDLSGRSAYGAPTRTKRSTSAPALKDECPAGAGHKNPKRIVRLALAPQAHDHVDARDFKAFRRCRGLADNHIGIRDVEHLILALHEEVMMGGYVGVEIGFRTVDGDLSQQTNFGELVQRVVDRRERDRDLRSGSLFV